MKELETLLKTVSDWVWGPPLLVLLCGTHVFLTLRLGFIQRHLGRAIRLSLGRSREGEGDVSQFASLMMALAATIGTGNIVGVATAVASGGPGAVFWMWLTGVFGMATKYAEALLAVHYRVTNRQGEMAGGPMYVLERGMHSKALGWAFACLTAVSAFGIGNLVQANSVSSLVHDTWGVSAWITGAVLMVVTGLTVLGGIRSIASVCRVLVPCMAVCYILGCLVILVLRIEVLPDAFWAILKGAFTGRAAVGGFVGVSMREAVRYGIARGLFSNESGLGSAPIVAAAAQTPNPVRQALVSMTGTFWNTVVVCALSGLVIVASGHWHEGLDGAMLTRAAFGAIPVVGPALLTVGLITFVVSTLIGWGYYGEKAVEYLFGTGAIRPYRWLWVAAVMVGSVASLGAVWSMADITNGLMAIPNLLSLIVLNRVLVAQTRKHLGAETGGRRSGGG